LFYNGNTQELSINPVSEQLNGFLFRCLVQGCSSIKYSDAATLTINEKSGDDFVPNVFTPNGTALNETFGPHCISCKTIYIQIYNRWGECIYKGSEPWDGTYRGEPVPNGTYAYKMGVELTFGSTLQNSFFYGDVQVLR
jgi:gliding motility-associated-like protein